VLLPFTALLGLILVSSRILSGAIWQLYVFYLALGVVSGGAGAMLYTDVVSHWFDRHRGLALERHDARDGLGCNRHSFNGAAVGRNARMAQRV
jgi:hypothetical protein